MLTDLAKHVQPLVADVRRRIVRDEDQPSGSRADASACGRRRHDHSPTVPPLTAS